MSVAMAFAGKIAAPIAAKAAAALAGPLGMNRFRIGRRVAKATQLDFSQKNYRQWIKALRRHDFEEPVETSAPRLAIDLDVALSAANSLWAQRPGHMSASLQLVEATYAELLMIIDGHSASTLMAQWSRQRNETVLSNLAEIVCANGAYSSLSARDLALFLHRRSWERRTIRLEFFGIEPVLRPKIAAILSVKPPIVEPGQLRIIVGSFGSGKTELAEEWHRACAEEMVTDSQAPIPIWISARDLGSGTLDNAIATMLGTGSIVNASGAAIVIDGLDEIDNALAEDIVRDARLLIAGNAQMRCLLTSRPNVVASSTADIKPAEVTVSQLQDLLEVLGSRRVLAYTWPPALTDSVKRPFFALAAATSVSAGEAAVSQATLMRTVVNLAMKRASRNEHLTEAHLFKELSHLATALTSQNEPPFLNFAAQARLLRTRIVVRTGAEQLRFSLPILQQWFAAQQMLEDASTIDSAFSDVRSYGRWRWAAAMALSSSEVATTDAIMIAALRLNPGAAGWLLGQVAAGYDMEPSRSTEDFTHVADRTLLATRHWINSIGPLTPHCFPIEDSTSSIRLGLRISDSGWQTWAWSKKAGTEDEVISLPDAVSFMSSPHEDWHGSFGGHPRMGAISPWLAVRENIAAATLKVLEKAENLTATDGIWHNELFYHRCRLLLDRSASSYDPLQRVDVQKAAQRLVDYVGELETTRFQFERSYINGVDMGQLVKALEGDRRKTIERPAPLPRFAYRGEGDRMTREYDEQSLVRYVAEVYGNACEAYDELTLGVFRAFDWTFGNKAYAPFAMVGTVSQSIEGRIRTGPHLQYHQTPLSLMDAIESEPEYILSFNGRAAFACMSHNSQRSSEDLYSHPWNALRDWNKTFTPPEGPFGNTHSGAALVDLHEDRPASQLAARWVHSDLKALGLSGGTFPQFRH